MIANRLRIASVVGLVLALLLWNGLRSQRPVSAAPEPRARKAPKELLEKRRDAARKVWQSQRARQISGPPRDEMSSQQRYRELLRWSKHWLEAELALRENQEDRIQALVDHVNRTRALEEELLSQVKSQVIAAADVAPATYERTDAEIRYYEATGKAPPPAARREREVEDGLPGRDGERPRSREVPGRPLQPSRLPGEESTVPAQPRESPVRSGALFEGRWDGKRGVWDADAARSALSFKPGGATVRCRRIVLRGWRTQEMLEWECHANP